MMTRLFRAAILIALVLTAEGAFAATTHYISKSLGADTNNGTGKTTPWAHLPGMHSCTSNCGSYTPVAGDKFILYGGDSWVASDLGVDFFWNGNGSSCVLPYGTGATSSCIYIGVDQTWFNSSVCGSSWCRPIWNCGGTVCGGESNFIYAGDQYLVIDNIEMTGMRDNANYIYTDQANIEARNIYMHGWSHSSGSTSNLSTGFQCNQTSNNCVGTYFHDSVIDGADTSKDMFWGTYGGGLLAIYNNYYRYTSGAVVNAGVNFLHDNTIEYCVDSFDGNHANCVFIGGPLSGLSIYTYNNVIRHTTGCAGCVKFWFNGTASANPSYLGYFFNNISYDQDPSNIIDITPSSASSGDWGNYYIFNNTYECGTDSSLTSCTWGEGGGHTLHLHITGNHWITSAVCGPGTCSETNDLTQTVALANAKISPSLNQYTSLQSYVFSPVAITNSTVGTGVNMQSICSTLAAVDAGMGAACQKDTTYAVGYDAANHKVIAPARTPNARPASGAWDIGAYQFSSSQAQAPQPPTSLQASVQ